MMINETPFDRAVRGAAGLALIVSPLVGLATAPYNLLGIVPLVTGVLGYCPLYAIFGLSTCTKDSYQHQKEGIVLKEEAPGTEETVRAH